MYELARSAEDTARALLKDGVASHVAAACAARMAGARERAFSVEQGGDVGVFFDLASLTKPMLAVALARSGLPLGRRLEEALPELGRSASAGVTMEMLLAHRAGLLPHVALYAPLLSGARMDTDAALRAAADARRDECSAVPIPPDGFPAVYSDVGYVLAGAALARHLGAVDAGAAIERLVVEPLGLGGTMGTARTFEAAGTRLAERAAPTEEVAWRGGVVRGSVHDENAWALTGAGGSGHAGMFGTIGAVIAFGCAILEGLAGRGALSDARLDELLRPRPGGTLRAGFDGKSETGSSAGASFGGQAFGHLGFTGTSLWIDPDAGVIVALLTNRVHPSRDNVKIRAARPVAHEALFQRALDLRTRGSGPP